MADYPDFEKLCGYGGVTAYSERIAATDSFWAFVDGLWNAPTPTKSLRV